MGVQQSRKGRIWENWEEFQRAYFLGCLVPNQQPVSQIWPVGVFCLAHMSFVLL